MRLPPKFGTCEILANFYLAKKLEKKVDFGLVQPTPYK